MGMLLKVMKIPSPCLVGVKLFGAIGVGEDGPRPFFAVVEYVCRARHPLLRVRVGDCWCRRQSRGRPHPPVPPPRWEEGAMGEEGPCLCPSEEDGSGAVEGGACSFEQMVSGSRVDSRAGVVCACLRWWTAASVALFPWIPSLSAGIVVVLRLCDSSERGAQALAGSGRLSSRQTFCRPNLALQHRWVKWSNCVALGAHLIVLRWVTRAFRRRGDSHVDIVRHRGRRSGARVSGRLLHAKPKIAAPKMIGHALTPRGKR
eukprot:scaffold7214_cov114-Isochrysis_galbana.AAC.3